MIRIDDLPYMMREELKALVAALTERDQDVRIADALGLNEGRRRAAVRMIEARRERLCELLTFDGLNLPQAMRLNTEIHVLEGLL